MNLLRVPKQGIHVNFHVKCIKYMIKARFSGCFYNNRLRELLYFELHVLSEQILLIGSQILYRKLEILHVTDGHMKK